MAPLGQEHMFCMQESGGLGLNPSTEWSMNTADVPCQNNSSKNIYKREFDVIFSHNEGKEKSHQIAWYLARCFVRYYPTLSRTISVR